MGNSITMVELVPVGTVFFIAVLAASAAYLVQRRATPDRTRGAMAYQVGFLAGLAATLALASVPAAFAMAVIMDTPIAEAGMLAAFFGPFAGMVHAELRTLAEEATATAQVHSTFRPFRHFLDSLSANAAQPPRR